MFPLPWNFPFRKKDGSIVNVVDAMGGGGGGGSDLPDYDSSDEGKLLSVDENGNLEWSDTVNSEIQTLTNNLSDEVETRAKLTAHNIFPLTIADLKALNTISGTWSENSFTMYGITYNCEVTNGYVSKITVSGTSTETSTLELFGKYAAFASNKYKGNILSGCPSGGSGNSYCIIEQTSASSAGTSPDFSRDEGSGAVIGNNDYARLYIRIEGGYAISGSLIFQPMIRLASDPSTAYAPYAMTNRELTEVKTGTISNGADYSTYIDSATDQSLIKVGKMCIFNYNFVLKAAATADKTVFTLSEKPTNTTRLRGASQDNNHPLDLKITTSGEVQVYQGVANTRYNGQFIFFAE